MTSFLTSPVTTEGLRLYLSETTSVPPQTQISLAPVIKHREEVVDNPSSYNISMCDVSQDIESNVSLSEGDLEQLNVTLTEDGSDQTMSKDNSSTFSTPEKDVCVDTSALSNHDVVNTPPMNKSSVDINITVPNTSTTPLTDRSACTSSSSIHTSLPSSLTDLADTLGTNDDNSTPRHQEEENESVGVGDIDGGDGFYNPFESGGLFELTHYYVTIP